MSVESGVGMVVGTEDEFAAELWEMCAETAPRRFAICAVQGECEDGAVVGWGLALDGGRAVVCHAHTRAVGRFRTADGACRLFARRGPIRLVWIDPEPPAPVGDLPADPGVGAVVRSE